MSVAIVDYGSGNLHSAAKAFERAARDSGSDAQILVTADPEQVAAAERIVLPGVGAFADCLAGLSAVSGMIDALREAVLVKGRPFFGICVGMQLLATRGLEYDETAGLNWIGGDVRLMTPDDPALKIPHMGWNNIRFPNKGRLFAGVPEDAYVYFVHSYYLKAQDEKIVTATTEYGTHIHASVESGNLFACQFHPEKSSHVGLQILKNFAKLEGKGGR